MKVDVRIMFDQFHGNECLPKGICSYFLTLIPKVSSPQALGDFRPISLLGCLYKLIAKVLAARLSKVLDELIPNSQSAFLKGRQLVDGVVVVNEVIDFARKAGKDCLILKVDFEKAYDSVDWGFLDYMLRRFDFGAKWCAWMKACVCSGNMSVLLNGSPTEEISIRRGLKQGDPLAPFLFLIVAEGLGALMRKAVEIGRFQPFLVGRGNLPVSILQYADDTLCIGQASVENLWALKAILRGFEMASGPKREGGLGVRDLRVMNISLLTKWRWKLLLGGDELWKKVVVARYGAGVLGVALLGEENRWARASVWWRDVCNLDKGLGWFSRVAIKKLGERPLNEVLEGCVDRRSDPRVEFSTHFFVWEEALLQQLLEVISHANITEAEDRWTWILGSADGFSVKSCYVFLEGTLMLHNPRIPTRDNLCRRGVISEEVVFCPLCEEERETSCHLFLHCRVAASIWYGLTRWLGVVVVLPPLVAQSYAGFVGCGSNKKRKKGFSIVWLAFVWALWQARNDRVFNNKEVKVEEVVVYIQRLSWRWFLSNTAKGPCLLYEWVWNPGDCMLR
ncbi:hypothetical protein TSUD_406440 [Trifolium subterraneum]|uniref:Reverse transcriptase domain-containing protein n=1 Tax=Trifolium subterraneum TaxID=3900 RepID=A0A2Z6NX60_TRISU|nr:hypothetical protein TSUD_406440 [Trifolium subterraneum]